MDAKRSTSCGQVGSGCSNRNLVRLTVIVSTGLLSLVGDALLVASLCSAPQSHSQTTSTMIILCTWMNVTLLRRRRCCPQRSKQTTTPFSCEEKVPKTIIARWPDHKRESVFVESLSDFFVVFKRVEGMVLQSSAYDDDTHWQRGWDDGMLHYPRLPKRAVWWDVRPHPRLLSYSQEPGSTRSGDWY